MFLPSLDLAIVLIVLSTASLWSLISDVVKPVDSLICFLSLIAVGLVSDLDEAAMLSVHLSQIVHLAREAHLNVLFELDHFHK